MKTKAMLIIWSCFVPVSHLYSQQAALSFNNALSKVIIEYGQFIPAHNCYSGSLIFIFVWSKYQPIPVSWDSAYFLNNVCICGSFLSNH